MMFKHAIIFAIRSFRSRKLIFFGSILTVFLGTLSISLLYTYVNNELTMDNFNKREKDILITALRESVNGELRGISASKFLEYDYKDEPGIEYFTSVHKYNKGEITAVYAEKSYLPEMLLTDNQFFKIFDYTLLVGDKNSILNDPESLIITEDYAKEIFGDNNPIGQTIVIKGENERNYVIKGIVQNPPSNSSIKYDLIAKYDIKYYQLNSTCIDFLLTNNEFDIPDFTRKIDKVLKEKSSFTQAVLELMPLDNAYFNIGPLNDFFIFNRHGDKKSIFVIITIMIIILLITILNFNNLQVIHLNSGINTMYIKRIVGANSKELIFQKFAEAGLLIILSTLLTIILYVISLPLLNKLVKVIISPPFLEILLIIFAIITIIFLFGLMNPVLTILKNSHSKTIYVHTLTEGSIITRKPAIIFQLTLTMSLIIASFVVFNQLNMMLNKDLGFETERIIKIKMYNDIPSINNETTEEYGLSGKNGYQFLLNELSRNPAIDCFAQGLSPIEPESGSFKIAGKGQEFANVKGILVSAEYIKLFGMKLTEGRLDKDLFDGEYHNKIIINEAAKKFFNIDDISKDRLTWSMYTDVMEYEIVGIVKDFNYEHLSVKPSPLILIPFINENNDFFIKLKKGNEESGLKYIKQLYEEVNHGEPFVYTFLSDDISSLYQKEKQLSQIYLMFTIIALLITCTGLFTIVFYETQHRIKEIGIRKINGARAIDILKLLNADFLKWVLISFAISCPVSWYAMHNWLGNFAYKTGLCWWIFALAGLFVMVITLVTVNWQIIKASSSNPVESLKYE